MATEQQYYLNNFVGDKSWGDLNFQLAEPARMQRAQAELGSYSIELLPDGKTYRLSFDGGSGIRTCSKKFQVINTAQEEASDHHRRLLAQRQAPARMKPPKW